MTFSNLCALYENACLDYEVSVLTEGADSEEAKTAKAKKTGLGKKVFAAVGAVFEALWEIIRKLLKFIKTRFIRDKIKLANDVQLVPVKDYKTIIADLMKYVTAGDEIGIKTIPVKSGTVVDKTAYVEILEKLEELVKRFAFIRIKAENFIEKSTNIHDYIGNNSYAASADKLAKKELDATVYAKAEKYVKNLVKLINRDIQAISSNAVPEDVAPVNDKKKKEKADTNNESAMFGGLTRNELRAKLLIEAADALAADDNATNTDALGDNGDGKVTPTCLDCDKEEADIDDDYLPPVSGADDDNSDPEMDEIEDLLDDEKDAIDILTDKEGTETVDAQEPTLESILGLNF